MKTRIKVIEYNSGKKEFVCQYQENEIIWKMITFTFMIMTIGTTIVASDIKTNDFSNIFLTVFVASIILPIMLLRLKQVLWKTFNKPSNIGHAIVHVDANFDNMDDARKFINEKLQEAADKVKQETENTITKIDNIKYP